MVSGLVTLCLEVVGGIAGRFVEAAERRALVSVWNVEGPDLVWWNFRRGSQSL